MTLKRNRELGKLVINGPPEAQELDNKTLEFDSDSPQSGHGCYDSEQLCKVLKRVKKRTNSDLKSIRGAQWKQSDIWPERWLKELDN